MRKTHEVSISQTLVTATPLLDRTECLYTDGMSAILHTLSLLLAIAAAFVWLHVPWLAPYSLQVFAAAVILYLVIKRIKKSALWHVAPGVMSVELALLTFAVLLVIGHTGDTQSLLFSLSYILLFFLVFSAEVSTAIVSTIFIMLYFYALANQMTSQDAANLLTLPLMLVFFIFAKAQYQQVTQKRDQLAQEEQDLMPKLEYLTTLLSHPAQNKQALEGQLTLLQVEIEKIVVRSEKLPPGGQSKSDKST